MARKPRETRGHVESRDVPDEIVQRVGKTARMVAELRASTEKKEEVEEQAQQIVRDSGVSIDDYNQVLTSAVNDPDLERRLLAAYPSD